MALILSSDTLLPAPGGQPHSRRTIGIGEEVAFYASVPARWTVFGTTSARPNQIMRVQFRTPGIHVINAEAGRDRASIQVTVVTPSVRVNKTGELRVPEGLRAAFQRVRQNLTRQAAQAGGVPVAIPDSTIGAAMTLEFTLTPLSVSFANVEFREQECRADEIWGYWAEHRAKHTKLFNHRTHLEWSPVTDQNLAMTDLAGFWITVAELEWPLTPGGYRFPIPNEYRITPLKLGPRIDESEILAPIGPQSGSDVFRFNETMHQTIRMDPTPGSSGPPFHGTLTVFKGGQQVSQRF